MADIEFQIPHSKLVDDMSPGGKTVTDVNKEEFHKNGLNFCDCNDATYEDDNDKGVRNVKVKGIKHYFTVDVNLVDTLPPYPHRIKYNISVGDIQGLIKG
jgi:hypothetical protein